MSLKLPIAWAYASSLLIHIFSLCSFQLQGKLFPRNSFDFVLIFLLVTVYIKILFMKDLTAKKYLKELIPIVFWVITHCCLLNFWYTFYIKMSFKFKNRIILIKGIFPDTTLVQNKAGKSVVVWCIIYLLKLTEESCLC